MTDSAAVEPIAEPLDAAASDPNLMGWMQGAPPPFERQVRFDDGSMYTFPKLRWAYSNMRRLLPTSNIERGDGPVSVLPRADRDDIDGVAFEPLGRSGESMSWAQSLDANYTDGIVVLQRGCIVYERYFGALDSRRPHIAWSVTKSVFGTLAAALVAEARLDPQASVESYVPELGPSAFGRATLRQVLDMTTALDHGEDYADPQSEFWEHGRAGGMLSRPAGQNGLVGFYEYLKTVRASGPHGQAFAYKTVNTDVLGWILRRATGLPLGELLQQLVWGRLGAEQDAYMTLDTTGTEFAGAGFNCCLRDLARFGEMLRCGGFYNGQQIVPKGAIDDIRGGGDRGHFAQAGYATLPGWSYRDMWWVSHNDHDAYCARGIHGQGLYIDPAAEMVIARFASHPMAGNVNLDPTTLPAYHALALHLMRG